MRKLNYVDGNMKFNGIYLEYAITSDFKIQFMDVLKRTSIPYTLQNIWHHNINVESIEEIIAKKIYFRGNKGNSRDLFDIAVAFHKNPNILKSLNLDIEKIKLFLDTVHDIYSDPELTSNYLDEIRTMNPHENFDKLSKQSIPYLFLLLSNHYTYLNYGTELTSEQCTKLESKVYDKLDEL